MRGIGDDSLVLALGTALLGQSLLVIALAVALKRQELEADKYADIVTYYTTILDREGVELTDYDLIALSTMFGDTATESYS